MKKRLGLFSLALALIVMYCLPAGIALAQGATVEVNSGETIILEPGQTIPASMTEGIPVSVKNLDEVTDINGGLAGITLHFSWEPDVVNLDSIFVSLEARNVYDWWILSNGPDNVSVFLAVTGFTTTYSTDDITLLYLGVTATGSPGDTGSIDVTIDDLIDAYGIQIAAMPVSAPVIIPSEEVVNVTWLPPLTTQEIYTAQAGSTIPVKFQLTDGDGLPITGEEVMVTVTRNSDSAVVFSGMAVYQDEIPGYKINVKTKGWEDGEYTISLSVSEDATYGLVILDKGKGNMKQKGKGK